MRFLTALFVTIFSIHAFAKEEQFAKLTDDQLRSAKAGILSAVTQQKMQSCVFTKLVTIRNQKKKSESNCESDFFSKLVARINKDKLAGYYYSGSGGHFYNEDSFTHEIHLVDNIQNNFPPIIMFRNNIYIKLSEDLKKVLRIVILTEAGFKIGTTNSGTILEPILNPEYEMHEEVHVAIFEQ